MTDKFFKGLVAQPTEDRRCGHCGFSNFAYNNGQEYSQCGTRGYRCVNCGCIKPENATK